ncbi:MAG: hypothetical protein APF76_04195 [Desulfitibacter sp. BRH_c19]|nr:MAG: hypothetical protein APF76_04195 [Desulfitibacter sp. BRH_c19]
MGADLHVHTTASDGTLKAYECIQKAVDIGLEAISITDHDTVEGIDEAIETSKRYSDFIFVSGIELSTEYDDTEVHVLGYLIDHYCTDLKIFLNKMKAEREERSKKIVKKLNEIGIKISFEELKGHVNSGTIGRPHIAQLLVEKGHTNTIKNAFDKFLLKGRAAFVPRKKVSPEEAIQIILKANGLPVLAHPVFLNNKKQITDVLKLGFVGVEVEYPNHYIEFKRWLSLIAKEMDLLTTGGSDFHGGFKGTELGSHTVNISVIRELQRLKGERE